MASIYVFCITQSVNRSLSLISGDVFSLRVRTPPLLSPSQVVALPKLKLLTERKRETEEMKGESGHCPVRRKKSSIMRAQFCLFTPSLTMSATESMHLKDWPDTTLWTTQGDLGQPS